MAEPSIRILHFEDDPTDAELVRRYLRAEGGEHFHVTRVETLAGGLALLQPIEGISAESFDLILLDQRLPDATEADSLARVKLAAESTPIVIVTGAPEERGGLPKVREGAHDLLFKGRFDAPLLARVVLFAIERYRLQQALEAFRRREAHERELGDLEQAKKSFD